MSTSQRNAEKGSIATTARSAKITRTLLMIGIVVGLDTSLADAQQHDDPSVTALERALDRRMTVWRSPAGLRVQYVGHCRSAHGGCQRRVSIFARLIGQASERHQLDPFLLAAIAIRESGLNPLAHGPSGERGIVQLHPRGSGARVRFVRSEAYRQRCARSEAACQDEVLDVGARLLALNIERCGSVRDGLGAYNRGECGDTSYASRVMRERTLLLRLAKNEIIALADVN